MKGQQQRKWGLIIATLVSLVGIGLYFQIKNKSNDDPTKGTEAPMSAQQNTISLDEFLTPDAEGLSKGIVTLETTRGKIRYRMFPKEAPNTTRRMAELIQNGFYNGLMFHRVVPGFVIQGGDPSGTGMGGSGQKLKAEFNQHKHVPGMLAMARSADPNSADSQFYITLGTFPHLDNQYTIFGKVIDGQDVANAIQQGDKMTSVTLSL